MLNIEEIKKACEYTVDFKLHYKPIASKLGGGYMEYYEQKCSIFGLSMPNSIMYKLFLRKVLEGFNLLDNVQIVPFFNGEQWWCFDCGDNIYNLPSTAYDAVEESIEEAIKHIFKVKGVNKCKE